MGLFKDLKNKIEQFNSRKSAENNIVYQQIMDLLFSYSHDAVEISKFEKETGHQHFRTKEVEEKVLELIERDESVLTIMDSYNQNIGMRAVSLGLEEIVLRSLDNKEASLQQNDWKRNIGMLSANMGLKRATLKALDNYEASVQLSDDKKNIGMFAAYGGLEDAVIKALDNKEASCQRTDDGLTIAMMAVSLGMKNATKKALDNRDNLSSTDEYFRYNMAMYAADKKMEDIVLMCLDYEDLATQQDAWGRNIGMHCAENGLIKATAKSLYLYPETFNQKDCYGETIWSGNYIEGNFRNDVLDELYNLKYGNIDNSVTTNDNNSDTEGEYEFG